MNNEGGLDPNEIAKIVEKGDVMTAKLITEKLLENGIAPDRIIDEGLILGLNIVGDKYEEGEYFLPELISAGEAAKVVVNQIKSNIKLEITQKGLIVIGTVEGDVHTIGMELVVAVLEGAGYSIINLGSNVSSESFVESVKENNADILGMSALITTTMSYMKEVIDALEKNKLRKKVKVIVGGAPLDETYAKKIGADAYGKDAREALKQVEQLLRG